MGKSNTEQLKIAAKYLGQGGARFRKFCGLPSGAAWCDAFVSYIFNEAGNASLFCGGKKQTYCPTTIKLLAKDLAQVPLYLAMPSDVILFDWDRNGVPNHIGLVRSRVSTSSINTIEGNTSNKVMYKTRPAKYVCGIFRPHFKGTYKIGTITVDGEMGYNTIANTQKALNMTVNGILTKETVKRIQAYCGATQDGAWGPATSKKLQGKLAKEGYYTGKIDSEFGPASVKGLQRWCNAKNAVKTKPTTKPASKPQTTKPATKPTTTKPATTKPAQAAKLVSYKIDVDLTNQICTIYGVYDNKSTKALMSEFVSTARKGKTTPTGNFKISSASGGRKAKLRTAKMSSGKAYAEFLCRFHGGKCMHTVPYKSRQTTGHVNKNEFNKLGTPRSAGCVRMPWKLAQYIYERCPVGTPVRVFKGKAGAYPMGKPKKYTATTDIDPTYKK